MENTIEKKVHFGVYGIIESDSQLLAVYKSRGPYKNLFDLPGGRPKHGENIKETLIREIFEETGLKVQNFSFADDFSFLSDFFDSKGNRIELHHIGLIYFIHSVDQSGYDSSIFYEDVKGSSWINKDVVASKGCSPLLTKVLSL